MENKAWRTQQDTSHEEQRGEDFSLWDALDLAFLGENRPPDMLKPLLVFLNRQDTKTVAEALHELGEIGRRSHDGPKRGVIAYLLAKYLEDPRVEVRITATQAVGMMTRQTFAEVLASKLISDESARVRVVSAEALGELTMSVTLHVLRKSLSDPSWEVRAAAVQTLGNVGERLVIEPLRMALDDQDFSVRSAALHALGTFKGCLSTEYLVSLAQEETNDWITRDAAVTALERAGEHALAKPLRERLDYLLDAEGNMSEEDEDPYSSGQPYIASRSRSTPRKTVLVSVDSDEDVSLSSLRPEEDGTHLGETVSTMSLLAKRGADSTKRQETEAYALDREVKPPVSSDGEKIDSTKASQIPKRERHKGEKGTVSPKGKDRKPPQFKWEERVACASHLLRKCAESRQRGTMLLASIILIFLAGVVVPFRAGSILHLTYASGIQQYDNAHLVVETPLPESVVPGQRFSIRITALNSGSTTWTGRGNYRLICDSDDAQEEICGEIGTGIVSPSISPNRGASFTMSLIAPPTPGTYILRWTMCHDGNPFGDSLNFVIHVS